MVCWIGYVSWQLARTIIGSHDEGCAEQLVLGIGAVGDVALQDGFDLFFHGREHRLGLIDYRA